LLLTYLVSKTAVYLLNCLLQAYTKIGYRQNVVFQDNVIAYDLR
jgi:hypothetical protein